MGRRLCDGYQREDISRIQIVLHLSPRWFLSWDANLPLEPILIPGGFPTMDAVGFPVAIGLGNFSDCHG